MNDRGIASLAYNVLLRPGATVGAGVSFDTQKMNESTPKVRNPSLVPEIPSSSIHRLASNSSSPDRLHAS